MYYLIYVSSATEQFSRPELEALLAKSRQNNQRVNVTGLLLYKGGNFIQILEGEKEAVLATHARVSQDPRHRGMITMAQGNIEKRQFPDWSMGFQLLQSNEPVSLKGYSTFLSEPMATAALNGATGTVKALLNQFKVNM